MICGQTHGPTLGMGWQHVCGLRLRVDCLDGNHSISDMVFPCIASTTMADMDAVDIAEPQHHNHQHPHPRPQSRQQNAVKTGTWLPAEDVRLREAVAKYGTRWVRVAGEVGTRNGDQCAKRWNENLNPELDHGPWTAEEVSQAFSSLNWSHAFRTSSACTSSFHDSLDVTTYTILEHRLIRKVDLTGRAPAEHGEHLRPQLEVHGRQLPRVACALGSEEQVLPADAAPQSPGNRATRSRQYRWRQTAATCCTLSPVQRECVTIAQHCR